MTKKKWYKNQKIIIPLFLIFALLIIVGSSYALWQITLQQTGSNIITTGCFKIEFIDKNPINLGNGVHPITDEEGKTLTPYEFTLTNVCTSEATYFINLETVSDGEKILNEKYVKASLMEGEKEIFLNTLKDTYINTEKVLVEASQAFKLAKGRLQENESKTYYLRLWLDSETPAIDEVMNATYQGKITINLSYVPLADENRMMSPRTDENDIYAPFADTNKIVFQTENTPIEGIEPTDISINQTGGVLAYVDRSNADNIVTYIKADGLILFPEDSELLFNNFQNLTEIEGLENVNTYYTTNMASMFRECVSLESLDLSYFDTSNVEIMYRMFNGMSSLQSLNINNFDTSNVENMAEMFSGSNALTSLDLRHFNMSKVTDLSGMFLECGSLVNLNLSGWDVSNVYAGTDIFGYLICLVNLDISNWIVSSSSVIDFFNTDTCGELKYLNASGWHWKKFGAEYCRLDFTLDAGSSFETLDISNWKVEDKNPESSLRVPYSSARNLIVRNWVFKENIDELQGMFESQLYESIDLSGWDTSKMTNMDRMFYECSNLESLDLSDFDTSKVTSMADMFDGCSSLTNLDLSNFNTSNVDDMSSMFERCSSLTNLNVSNFNTRNVVIMERMFSDCISLTSLDLSSFDITNATNLVGMFSNDNLLENIIYSNKFTYTNNIAIDMMYDNCPANKPTDSSWNGIFDEEPGGASSKY